MVRRVVGVNDVATLRPDLVLEWDSANTFSLSDVTIGSGKMGLWLCSAGHSFPKRVN